MDLNVEYKAILLIGVIYKIIVKFVSVKINLQNKVVF